MLLGASNVGGAQSSFLTNANTTTTLTSASNTFSALSLGAEDANRYIVVGVSGVSGLSGDVATVTVAGVSATQLITNTSTTINVGLYVARVPTGATGDVVVTYTNTPLRIGVVLWRLTGLLSTISTATAVGGAASSNPQSNTIAVSADGVAFAISYANLGGTNTNPRYSAGSYSTATSTTLSFSVDIVTATSIVWTGIIEDVDPVFTGTSAQVNTWYAAASLR
jgi:hypothetical protein